MEQGIVSYWDSERGFGFIIPDFGGNKVFVHTSQVRGGRELQKGDAVTFEIGNSERTGKSEAQRVSLR